MNTVYNPHNYPLENLPVIYGFNAGKYFDNDYMGALISEEGVKLGSHICSDEYYMPHDLGILEGSRPDCHLQFQENYPEGYQMEFVSLGDVLGHAKLNVALKKLDKNAMPA